MRDPMTAAVWHEMGRRVRDDVTTTVYRTTPVGVARPARGTADAAVTCRVCRAAVPVRLVDSATARRRRLCGDVLRVGQYLLVPALLGAVAAGTAALGLHPGLLAGLAVGLALLLAVLGVAEWAEQRAVGATLLSPADPAHRIGPTVRSPAR